MLWFETSVCVTLIIWWIMSEVFVKQDDLLHERGIANVEQGFRLCLLVMCHSSDHLAPEPSHIEEVKVTQNRYTDVTFQFGKNFYLGQTVFKLTCMVWGTWWAISSTYNNIKLYYVYHQSISLWIWVSAVPALCEPHECTQWLHHGSFLSYPTCGSIGKKVLRPCWCTALKNF